MQKKNFRNFQYWYEKIIPMANFPLPLRWFCSFWKCPLYKWKFRKVKYLCKALCQNNPILLVISWWWLSNDMYDLDLFYWRECLCSSGYSILKYKMNIAEFSPNYSGVLNIGARTFLDFSLRDNLLLHLLGLLDFQFFIICNLLDNSWYLDYFLRLD